MESPLGHSLQHKKNSITAWLDTGSINVFGRPFAGKDTQSNRLAAWLNAPIVGGGEILRSQQMTWLKDSLAAGYLTPQDEFLSIITPFLLQREFSGKPLILSSVGRWHGEETHIMEALHQAAHPLKAVVYIKIDPQEAFTRLETSQATRDRDDDKHHVLENRLQEFANKTQPVIDFYQQQGLLVTVQGKFSPEDVETDIIDSLFELATKSSRALASR